MAALLLGEMGQGLTEFGPILIGAGGKVAAARSQNLGLFAVLAVFVAQLADHVVQIIAQHQAAIQMWQQPFLLLHNQVDEIPRQISRKGRCQGAGKGGAAAGQGFEDGADGQEVEAQANQQIQWRQFGIADIQHHLELQQGRDREHGLGHGGRMLAVADCGIDPRQGIPATSGDSEAVFSDWMDILAACGRLSQAWLPDEWLGLGGPASLFLLGLVGGATHCAGMCGPFVLGQVGRKLADLPLAQVGRLQRLSGMALLPYHAGRLTTYAALGAASGGLAGGVGRLLANGSLPAAALLMAALLVVGMVLVQPAALATGQTGGPVAWRDSLSRSLIRFGQGNTYLFGVALGFLPCGLLYTALLLAGASGNWLAGAAMMAAFALGTMPALLVVGFLGAAAGARWRRALTYLMTPVLLLNIALLLLLAVRWFAP